MIADVPVTSAQSAAMAVPNANRGALRFVHACMFVTPRYCALVLVKMETHIPMIFLCFKSHRCIIFHRFNNIPDFLISQSP